MPDLYIAIDNLQPTIAAYKKSGAFQFNNDAIEKLKGYIEARTNCGEKFGEQKVLSNSPQNVDFAVAATVAYITNGEDSEYINNNTPLLSSDLQRLLEEAPQL